MKPILALFVLLLYSCEAPLGVGSEAMLRNDNPSIPVLVVVEKDTYSKLVKTVEARDDAGYRELFATGRVFSVTSNTKVLIIDQRLDMKQIRILEGPSRERAGWVHESRLWRK
ncbi:MAG: hypothetical protein AB1631_15735 [Acidobacteriota bacterium]